MISIIIIIIIDRMTQNLFCPPVKEKKKKTVKTMLHKYIQTHD